MIRRGKPTAGRKPRVRPALSRASWAVEDRVVWGGVDIARRVFDVVRWPFERAVWAVERGVAWPLQKRSAGWSSELKLGSGAALALVAIGACVLGVVLASGGGGATAVEARHVAPPPVTVAPPVARNETTQAEPVLHGAPPDFTPEDKVGAGKAVADAPAASDEGEETPTAESGATSDAAAASSSGSTADASEKVVAIGPTATKVAHRFSGAFVHFETGQVDRKVRTAFAETATPQLARSLLHRPPRLPSNVKVPRAKVLNIVPGPKLGDTYTLSVSLLRVGVTSELRIEMERDPTSREWRVTDVLG